MFIFNLGLDLESEAFKWKAEKSIKRTNYLLFIANYLLFVTNYLLLTN